MADPALGLERSFDSTYSPVAGGDRPPVDRLARTAVPADQRDLATQELGSLLKLATRKQETGSDTEAEEAFRKALDIADRTLGPEHPDVALLLTDLTRLYLKRSAYAAAEPLLLRLLEMKRTKGDDHPEVATVLASLAAVRQALGRHESAEQLWRRVLDIRERTLAPNHFAIATALEHLGDACAARGKIGEGLSAFQRALAIRERTLGAEHPSLRISRERIADLQLQGSEDSLDFGGIEIAAAPDRYRLIPSGPQVQRPSESTATASIAAGVQDKPVAPAPAPAPKKPAIVIHGKFVDQASLVADSAPAVEAESRETDITAAALPIHSEPVVFRDALESLREEIEKPYAGVAISARVAEAFARVRASVGKREALLGAVVLVLAALGIASVSSSHALGESDAPTSIQAGTIAISQPTITPAQPARLVAATQPATDDANSKSAPARPRPVEERPVAAKKAPEKKADLKPIAIPALSTAVISRMDSAAAKAGSVSSPIADAMLVPAAPTVSTRRSTFGEPDQTTTAPLRARLIGDMPTPRVPDQVADIEGEVRVQFNVDVEGKPVMSTFSVVHSPNQLLSTAVRKVIPGMRFEPARTGGPDPRPIVDVVQIGFQFSRRE